MIKCWVSVRLETAPTGVVEWVSCAILVIIKHLASKEVATGRSLLPTLGWYSVAYGTRGYLSID